MAFSGVGACEVGAWLSWDVGFEGDTYIMGCPEGLEVYKIEAAVVYNPWYTVIYIDIPSLLAT